MAKLGSLGLWESPLSGREAQAAGSEWSGASADPGERLLAFGPNYAAPSDEIVA